METIDQVFKKETLTPWQEMEGKALVLTPQKSAVHELNETATFIWRMLDGETSVRAVVTSLCNEFDVPTEQATADTITLIGEMREKGMLLVR
ncbi:MAG: PqqD family protein [Pseudomonadota bacterium]|nr:PqqD family protein [Pseudomonadota bacterium]